MKNILVILMIVVAIGYMFVIMGEKYDNAVKVQEKIKQNQQVLKTEPSSANNK